MKNNFIIYSDNIPLFFIKTKYEDISGNSEIIYYAIDAFHFKGGVFHFSLFFLRSLTLGNLKLGFGV